MIVMGKIIGALLVGGCAIALGIFNLRGNISSIHWYNRRNVTEENAPKYCRLMGIGTILLGAGVIVGALLEMLLGTIVSDWIIATAVGTGLVIMVYAQFKYNKGIF